MSFGIQHHGTQTFRHTVGPISFCFFAQANQPLIGAGMQSQQAWQHTASQYQYAIYVPLFMRGCIAMIAEVFFEAGIEIGLWCKFAVNSGTLVFQEAEDRLWANWGAWKSCLQVGTSTGK